MPVGSKPQFPVDVSKIIFEGTMALKNWANIFYALMGFSGTPTALDVLNLAVAAHNAYGNRLQVDKSDTSTLQSTKVIYLPPGGGEITAEHAAPIAGTNHTTPLPNNCALAISWPIDSYYRGGHPRTYLDSLSEGDTTDHVNWTSAVQTGFETHGADFISDMNAITTTHFTITTLGTVRFASHNVWLAPPEFFNYTAATVHPRIDSQRRRLGKEA
jgi:hypothetical protein